MMPGRRRLLVPEVVQTSAMDCGPAALKCLLEGHGIAASYGRLREACQTDVDGTSIDSIEAVAQQLGLDAEQVLVPLDHVQAPGDDGRAAVVVVRQADGATHFVVVWRRVGRWLQLMDPALGRRWVRREQFLGEVFVHRQAVPAAAWREWAGSEEFTAALRRRLSAIGADAAAAGALLAAAQAEGGWFGYGALDAGVRFVQAMVDARGLQRGAVAARLVATLFEQTCASTEDIFRLLPRAYWSAVADHRDEHGALHLMLQGAVLVRVARRAAPPVAEAGVLPQSPELTAALREPPFRPLATAWRLLSPDRFSLAALVAALGLAAGAVLLEMLLLRGLFDIGSVLGAGGQRLGAVLALAGFAALLLLLEWPIALESARLGRHLETRLRMALLDKLPRLADRYFHSRPISDMAERSHSLHLARLGPGFVLQALQTVCALVFTLAGIAWIDRQSLGLALALVGVAVGVPLALRPLLNERDLRVRNHAAAMTGFYLDALQGVVPIRTHAAQRAVQRRHEGLLVDWARAMRSLLGGSIAADSLQGLLGVALAALLLFDHFQRSAGALGADLLLVYWTLKLPALGHAALGTAQQLAAQRNVLMRLVEPLAAPDELADDTAFEPAHAALGSAASATADEPAPVGADLPRRAADARRGVSLFFDALSVRAAGHTLLEDLSLRVEPGEQVAIVGSSGAGKSTLLGLLLGWHRPASGELQVDGMALTSQRLPALRRATAWVDPAIQLWNRPLLDNLTCAADGEALAGIGSLLGAADLHGILKRLPDGLQTYLGEGGALLSGGEGQRVRLARALFQPQPRLVLLDEPFRGLERSQRSALLAQARAWWQGATLLCVTHDVAETLSFDRVLVVEQGRIVEDGSPMQLFSRHSRYRELLAAERQALDALWQGPGWRRVRVEDGRTVERLQQAAVQPSAELR